MNDCERMVEEPLESAQMELKYSVWSPAFQVQGGEVLAAADEGSNEELCVGWAALQGAVNS